MIANLDFRLQTIAGLVRSKVRVADIGCDHALLLCALAKQNRIVGGIACEKNEGPLQAAKRNAVRFGVSNLLDFRLGDGLHPLMPHEADDIVIAGMGGETIANILTDCPWHISPDQRFILQPMTRIYTLRKVLFENGFSILSENTCKSDNRIHSVLLVSFSGVFQQIDAYDPACFIGSLALDTDGLAKELVKRTMIYLGQKNKGLKQQDFENTQKITSLINALKIIVKG